MANPKLKADITLYAAVRSKSMKNYQKYNKRRRSITEFRSSYNDSKNKFVSTDKRSLWMPIVKYILIAAAFIFIALMSFLVTDALLNISETPYSGEKVTVAQEDKTDIDKKYFENIETKTPDEIEQDKGLTND